jgi:natural product biosynthesis luciferase-like monooxygenase protein
LHQAFEQRAARSPNAIAVRSEDATLTYRELNSAANRLADRLRTLAVVPAVRVGILPAKPLEMLVAGLAVLKAGGVCAWFQPTLAKEDSQVPRGHAVRVVLAGAAGGDHLAPNADVVSVDVDTLRTAADSVSPPVTGADVASPFGVTIDSASGGEGELVRHADALRLAAAFDLHVGGNAETELLVVDAVAGDVALVAQLWALCRGTAIQYSTVGRLTARPAARPTQRSGPSLSLSFFGSYGRRDAVTSYRDLLEVAVHADRTGLSAVWVPERHFDAFGGIFPSPALLCAALARETQRIQLRAGSVVLPLHNPIRVAEEWSVVDNLSNGRVGISLASGWHPRDFVLSPETYASRRESMLERLAIVQRLWRGETIQVAGPDGKLNEIRLHPLPVQGELPAWLTSVSSPATWAKAGELGVGVLTNLMSQSLDDLRRNIATYRAELERCGHSRAAGTVTVMLHTYLADDPMRARAEAREPFLAYLRSAVDIFKTFVNVHGRALEEELTDEDVEWLLAAAYERYVARSALIGSPRTCRPVLDGLAEMGVEEVACLVDFGLDHRTVMQGLETLGVLAGTNGFSSSPAPSGPWAWPRPSLMLCGPAARDALDRAGQDDCLLGAVRAVLFQGDEQVPPSDALAARIWQQAEMHAWLGRNGEMM